jgi:4-amino-4-deoxy-L-arabinose transferase-like glycosyltransferase
MQNKALKIIILFLIPLLLYVVSLPFSPLMEPDEGRYSAIPSAMNATGDYVTPRLKQAVYFEKPPLAYWATAIAFRIFGENEFSSRLFAALCAWGCIILTYRMGLFFHDTQTGLYAGAILTTFLYHAAIGRINILDMPLAFFVCVAIWSGFRYFASTEAIKIRLYLFYIFSALAFLTKGLIGIVFPFGHPLAYYFTPMAGYLRAFFAHRHPMFCGHRHAVADPRPKGKPGLLPVFLHSRTPAQVRHPDA